MTGASCTDIDYRMSQNLHEKLPISTRGAELHRAHRTIRAIAFKKNQILLLKETNNADIRLYEINFMSE